MLAENRKKIASSLHTIKQVQKQKNAPQIFHSELVSRSLLELFHKMHPSSHVFYYVKFSFSKIRKLSHIIQKHKRGQNEINLTWVNARFMR